MKKIIFNIISITAFFTPFSAMAGEIGVSHSLSNFTKHGTGKLTIESIKNIHSDEKTISVSGQISGLNYKFNGDEFSKDSEIDSKNELPNFTDSSGYLKQLSFSKSVKNSSSREKINTNLTENYSFSDNIFSQTSLTFSN